MVVLNRNEASEYLSANHFRVSAKTLARLASEGGGPVYRRVGPKLTAYRVEDLDRWAESRFSPPIKRASELPIQQHMAA